MRAHPTCVHLILALVLASGRYIAVVLIDRELVIEIRGEDRRGENEEIIDLESAVLTDGQKVIAEAFDEVGRESFWSVRSCGLVEMSGAC